MSQTPDKLNEVREYIYSALVYAKIAARDDELNEQTDKVIERVTTAYAKAMNEVIGEDVKPDFVDDDWFCRRCSFVPTDGTRDCICIYNNRLKRRQRQRLQGLLPNGKDE